MATSVNETMTGAPVTHTGHGAGAAALAPDHHAAAHGAEPQHFLQRIKLFSALSADECQHVVKRMKRRDFPPQMMIVREGQPGSSMFFITSGLVEVRKKIPIQALISCSPKWVRGRTSGKCRC